MYVFDKLLQNTAEDEIRILLFEIRGNLFEERLEVQPHLTGDVQLEYLQDDL